jgi:decaprenylphospho-beta-D-ribofuranose 2-oxidase
MVAGGTRSASCAAMQTEALQNHATGSGAAAPGPAIQSYSRLREARPVERHVARSHAEVAERLTRAAEKGNRITFRGGGRSFDDQALNDDIVVDVGAFDRVVSVDTARAELTVDGGARWGAILDATVEQGLLPHVVVTTSGATAAGTVSANSLSRCSPRYGHTGDHVVSLQLITPTGETLSCSRSSNADLFHAVVGGFGYFGFVAQVKFDLLRVGPRRRVRTVIDRCEGLPRFIERLTEASLAPMPHDAVYSVFSLADPKRGAVFRSTYTEEPVGPCLTLYRPYVWHRPLGELLFLSSRVSNAFCHASYRHEFGRGPFVDELRGYTFCMEGNERAKAIADRFGVNWTSLQHSYTVPTASLSAFLEDAARLFASHDVYPCLLDALYRPGSGYLLCASNGLPGFCVSYVFEGMGARRFEHVRRCLVELNEVALAMGGRLNLAKNVYATRPQLRRMYAHATGELAKQKARVDPRHVLANGFFDRAFGSES